LKASRMTISDVVTMPGARDLHFCQFLDDFRHESDESCWKLLAKEPPLTGNDKFDVKLAASAELLSRERGVVPPDWVYFPVRYFSKRAYMAPKVCAVSARARKWFEDTTPIEYASRNLYCGEDPLARC